MPMETSAITIPIFLVKLKDGRLVIVETKGQEDLDVPLKMARLKQWCEDLARVDPQHAAEYVFVDQESFEKYSLSSFSELQASFQDYQ